jgi:DNA gyrase subunit B
MFDGDGPDAAFAKKSGLVVAGRAKKGVTGTRTRYWADRQIFVKDAEFDVEALRARARQTAFLVPGLAIEIRDERGEGVAVETYLYKGGIAEYVEFLSTDEAVTGVLRLQGSGHFKETVPVLDGKGHMVSQEVERELGVDVALRWGTGYDTDVRSYVNIIATPKGGTHVQGFERALVKTVNEQMRAQKTLKVSEDNVLKDDIVEGLTAIVTVRLSEPQFEGQTKEVLGTPAATRIVSNVVAKELAAWISTPPRGDKLVVKAVLDKIAGAARTRIAARTHRDVQRRKNALESSALPAKLADCRSDDVARSELFIVEGDSALGTAKVARNAEHQALLPIRGKILNTQKASVADMLKNTECAAIIQVIGAGSGRSFDLGQARYGKIILMSDADVDGAHIRCLLLTLVHRYMRPLLEDGRVYAAVPPLHRFEITNPGTKKNDVVYTYSEDEYRKLLHDLSSKGRSFKTPQRYKGLGEMDASQLRETTMDPATRTLRRITMGEIDDALAVFDLLMGSDVAPRKEFIVDGAAGLDRTRIDA